MSATSTNPPRLHLPTAWLLLSVVLVAPARAATEQGSDAPAAPAPDVEAGSVVIQAEPPPAEPTIDDLLARFRERLQTERMLAPIERPLAGGMVEVETRYGRFCVPSTNAFNSSELGGRFGLASFCWFY
jgi:hypothetical protein